jgi:leucyl/phenylalanyl-tRNA---protein transferase
VPATRARTGQELTPELLLRAYAAGFFPMAEDREGPIAWYSPDPRAIIPLDGFTITRSLRQRVKKGRMEIRISTSFSEVMRRCAARKETWISSEIIEAYCRLFDMGYAHSVECWENGGLVGGLYGVTLGGAFFGESMFSQSTDASKIALWYLVRRLRERGFLLLDAQFLTPHLASLGAYEISRDEYLGRLHEALAIQAAFTDKQLRV